MKKSKSSSKDKRKLSSADSNKKRVKTVIKEKEHAEGSSRKSRWETINPGDETEKVAQEATSNPKPPRRLKDMLGDKKKIIEYIFLTVTVPTLQELIPDYLKNRSIEELKNLCFEEIKELSDEQILDVISGTQSKESEVIQDIESSPKQPSVASESRSSDLLELCASANDIKGLNDDTDNEASLEDQEILDTSRVNESEVDLAELEMRARAIRSLLKAKSQELPESDESGE